MKLHHTKHSIRKYILTAFIYLTQFVPIYAQGLKFQGMDWRIQERTSYDVFGNTKVKLNRRMDISFSICTYRENDFGYILRIIDGKKAKTIWNLSYDKSDSVVVRLNEEGRFSLIKAMIPGNEIHTMHWVDVNLCFDSICDSVFLSIDNKKFSAPATLPDSFSPKIQFGRSDFIIDVPSFAIRDLVIKGEKNTYTFPLSESSGNKASDLTHRIKGHVSNPTWLIRESLEWKELASMSLPSKAGANYDPERKRFYYYDKDSLYTYDVISNSIESMGLHSPMRIKLGTNFIMDGKLYAYETYNDDQPDGAPTLACLDLDSKTWTILGNDHLSRPVHHHASFFNDGHYEIFGGFGDKLYNGHFYTLTDESRWERDSFKGAETLFPRYFTAIGQDGNSVYVFGGMGNECGEQIVGRRYFYDLHKIDLEEKSCEKLWELDWTEEDRVPARTMVMDGNTFYVICYPEYRSESYIDLYAFSLKDGSFKKLANQIPIISDKMLTNTALYLDRNLKKFFVTTLVFDDDIRSTLKIYALSYPPGSMVEMSREKFKGQMWVLGICLFALVVLAIAALYVLARRKRKIAGNAYLLSKSHPEKKKFSQQERPNSIYLFGDFQVNNRDGQDISGRISAQRRQILWLLVKYSDSPGLSTARLSSIFWPDKKEEKVKNSRGVAINHLRKDLADVDGVSIVFEKGYYRLQLSEPSYCDVVTLLRQINSESPDINQILTVLSRGKFLKFVDDPVFDSYKSQIENVVTPVLHGEIVKRYKSGNWQEVIEIADMILYIDPLDETGLQYSVNSLMRISRKEDALLRYASFNAEYRKINDTDYPVPFEKLIIK